MASSPSTPLSELEKKARADALRRVAELFQKPDQLDKIDTIKAQFLNQKMATEAQLKMVLHSQLNDSKVGLDKLYDASSESQVCGKRIDSTAEELGGLKSLLSGLKELRSVAEKHSQLAAAMQNMSYLVKAPEAMEQARVYIVNESVLDGHKILQELEGIRDELMSEVHRDTPQDLDTLREYFKGLKDLNRLMQSHISHIGSRLFGAIITQNGLVVDYVRIIDREERADAIWKKRMEKNGFLPDGRPKRWKEILFDGVRRAVKEKVFGSAVDGDDDKSKLVRHNEIIRQYAMYDMKTIKNFGPTCFPADYNVFDRVVAIFHDTIAMHVKNVVEEGLTDAQIIQLLGWINAYHSDEFMKAPAFNIDFSRLQLQYPINLLPEDKLDGLRKQYVAKTIQRLRTWLINTVSKDSTDWKQRTAPELDGYSYYFTKLPVLIMTPVNELIGSGNLLHFLGSSVREQCLSECVQEMALFVKTYENQLREYHLVYMHDRSQFLYYVEYMLANANNAVVIADTFSRAMMQELASDTHLKGRLLVQINQLKSGYGKIVHSCCQWVQVPIFMDLDTVLAEVMTRKWLLSAETSTCLLGTLEDYDNSLRHLRPIAYRPLSESLMEGVILGYLRSILNKKCDIKTGEDRRLAGERISHDGQLLRDFFDQQMKVSPELLKAFEVFPAIAALFATTDVSILSLDIVDLQRKFPDIRPNQLYTLLMARNDVSNEKAWELSKDYENGLEATAKTSPFNLFTKLSAGQK